MKKYREYVECCSSCEFVLEGPMGEWLCEFGFEDTCEQMGVDPETIDRFRLLEEMERQANPYGKCDVYQAKPKVKGLEPCH